VHTHDLLLTAPIKIVPFLGRLKRNILVALLFEKFPNVFGCHDPVTRRGGKLLKKCP
jgi:hypothetical protein